MTTFFLIRHGANDTVGHGIAGRSPGVHLNSQGREQAEALALRLASARIDRVCSSPLERARETAQPLAGRLGLTVEVLDALQEVDFGEWTAWSFEALEREPRWRQFNRSRSIARIPGGELMLEAQTRMVLALLGLRESSPGGRIAIVSHGDPIRSALIHYAGIPLDLMHNIHVDLASVSVVTVEEDYAHIHCINHTGECPVAW